MFSVSIEYLLGLTEEQNYDELQFKTNPNLLDLDRIKILMRDYTDDQISVIINSINRYYSAINPSGTEEGGWDDGDVTFAFFLSHLTESVRRLLEFKTYDKNIKSDEREAARDVTKTHMILIVHLLAEIDRIAHGERSITSVLENQKSDEGNNLLLPEEWSVNNMDINTVSPDTDADESLRSKR